MTVITLNKTNFRSASHPSLKATQAPKQSYQRYVAAPSKPVKRIFPRIAYKMVYRNFTVTITELSLDNGTIGYKVTTRSNLGIEGTSIYATLDSLTYAISYAEQKFARYGKPIKAGVPVKK